MRTAFPILLVVALVFGVTFITQFSTTPPPATTAIGGPTASGPAIEFPTAQVGYDPVPADPDTSAVDHANKRFVGFFELGTENNLVPFHFRVTRPEPVRLSALHPSCGKCTSARGAVVPQADLDNYQATTARGLLPSLAFGPAPDLLSALAWAEVYGKLNWHRFDFARPQDMMTVPAGSVDRPTVGLIELAFKIGAVGKPSTVSAAFDLYDSDGKKVNTQPTVLNVMFAGREPFEVAPTLLDVGELAEGVEPKAFEVVAFSAVRDDFPPPTLGTVVPDPFLRVGPPVPLTAADRLRVAYQTSERAQYPIRVRSGYRYKIEVLRQADGKALDIGKLERELFAASPTTQTTYRVAVVGTVSGLVRLEDGAAKIDFGSYQAEYEKKKSVTLLSDQPGLELELVPEQCNPRWVTFTLGPPVRDGNRTRWPVELYIKAKDGRYPPWEGTLFLRTKGPNPTNIRIPVTGHGR